MSLNSEIKKYIKKGIIPFSVNIEQILNKDNEYKKNIEWCGSWKNSNLENPKIINSFNSVGLITGERSGIFVLDIDDVNEWKELLEDYEKDEPNTPKVISGSGGIHYYFKYTKDISKIPSRTRIIGKKIDSRNDGGCIFAPPSTYFSKKDNKNVSYKWEENKSIFEMELSEVPTWLYKLMLNTIDKDNEIENIKKQSLKNLKPTDLLNFEFNGYETKLNLSNEAIQEILSNLKQERAEDYSLWSNICFSLKCDGTNKYLNNFLDFSKKSKKYDKDSIINFWNNYKPHSNNMLTYSSLLYWLREDNKECMEIYNSIIKKYNIFKDDYYCEIKKEKQEDNKLIINQDYLLKDKKLSKCNVSNFINKFINEDYKVLKIKSTYNTGKTTLLKEICENYEKILFLSYRRTLSNNLKGNFKKLGFKLYNEEIKSDRLICQIDSIFKIPEHKVFDLIIVDESESILNHFSASTLKDKLITFEKITEYGNKAQKIIALDGDLDDRTNLYFDLFGKHLYLVNTIQKDERIYHIHQNENTFKKLMTDDLKNNKNIVFVCMNEKMANYFYELFCDTYKCILYTGISSDEQINLLARVEEIWTQYELIIYTPCIESGVDFNIPHIDNMYILLSSCSTSQRGVIQMANRTRQLENKNVHVLLHNLPYNEKSFNHYNMWEIINYYDKVFNDEKEKEFKYTYDNGEVINKTELRLHFNIFDVINMYNKQEILNKCDKCFYPLWKIMNEKKGHKFILYDEEKSKKTKIKNIKLEKICNVEKINKQEYEDLKIKQAQQNLTQQEKLQISKHFYEDLFGVKFETEEELKKYYNKTKIIKNAQILLNKKELILDGTKIINNERKTKLETIKNIMNVYNINATDLFNEPITILNTDLDNKREKINEIIEPNKIMFNFTKKEEIKTINKLIATLRTIFGNYGIEIIKYREGKKKVSYYTFQFDNIVKNKINNNISKFENYFDLEEN